MIALGDVYRIKMYLADGIKPKGKDTYRHKYIIIIGYDGVNYYAAVSTNTRDHHLVPIEFQYPIKHNGYNCFVNCFKLHQVSSLRLTKDCHQGKISEDDFDLIIGCVKCSPRIPKNVLKKFKIIT